MSGLQVESTDKFLKGGFEPAEEDIKKDEI